MRRPMKIHSLRKLKDMGVPVGSVIDVGILSGTFELMKEYAHVPQLLLEPIVEWNATIEEKYTANSVDFELLNVAVADQNGEMQMETSSVKEGADITHARLTDKVEGENIRTVQVRTLDRLMAERDYPGPYLLKLDVDGVEMKILQGAQKVIEECSVIVIEANVLNFVERANYITDKGFRLFDFVDICYYDDQLRQFDLIFLNTRTIAEHDLDMFRKPFEYSKWAPFQ